MSEAPFDARMDDAPFETLVAFSGRYRSAATRARVAIVFLALAGLVPLASVVHQLSGFGLIGDAEAGSLTTAQVLDFDSVTVALARVNLVVYLITAIAYLAWLSRTVDNVPSLGGGVPSVTPRWSIGWWFVPFLSLWRPYQIVREVHDRMTTPTKFGGGDSVLGWWLVWLAANSLAIIVVAQPAASTLDDVGGRFLLHALSDIGMTLAAFLAMRVIRRIQARADERGATAANSSGSEAFAPA